MMDAGARRADSGCFTTAKRIQCELPSAAASARTLGPTGLEWWEGEPCHPLAAAVVPVVPAWPRSPCAAAKPMLSPQDVDAQQGAVGPGVQDRCHAVAQDPRNGFGWGWARGTAEKHRQHPRQGAQSPCSGSPSPVLLRFWPAVPAARHWHSFSPWCGSSCCTGKFCWENTRFGAVSLSRVGTGPSVPPAPRCPTLTRAGASHGVALACPLPMDVNLCMAPSPCSGPWGRHLHPTLPSCRSPALPYPASPFPSIPAGQAIPGASNTPNPPPGPSQHCKKAIPLQNTREQAKRDTREQPKSVLAPLSH